MMTFLMVSFVAITPAVSESLSEKEIKKLALEAILENPQIVMDAVNLLRERDEANKESLKKQSYLDNKELLSSDPNAPTYGNPNADITIVEFFDYNCGYCKRAMTAMQEVLKNDKNLRVVYREFPILSEGSIYASRAALASRAQNKYKIFHEELMSAQQLNASSVMQIAKRIGLDVKKLQKDMNDPDVFEHIQTSRDLADALQFTGTPSFVIGDKLIGGYIPQETIMEIIESLRS